MTPTEDRGGVEATAREIACNKCEALAEPGWPLLCLRHWNERLLKEIKATIAERDRAYAEIAAALRAAPPSLENSRLEGNAVGQPTSVVTHDSEGRGMSGGIPTREPDAKGRA